MKRGAHLALRALAVLVSVVFLRASARKFFGAEETLHHFAEWGYPHWFMILVATIELLGALLLFIPRATRVACLVLTPIMLGAIGTQLIHAAYAKALIPATVLAMLVLLATRKTSSGTVPPSALARTSREGGSSWQS